MIDTWYYITPKKIPLDSKEVQRIETLALKSMQEYRSIRGLIVSSQILPRKDDIVAELTSSLWEVKVLVLEN